MPENTLYFGDNLDILRRYVADESVDLIYLDPPFNSNQAYNVIFEEENGSGSGAQIEAFDDTWHWTMETARCFQECVEAGGRVSDTLVAFRNMLGDTDMMAYLANMAPRLVELRRKLKPTGSLYLHCDEVAAHYLKVLLDAVFDIQFFRTEIIWQRTNVHSDSQMWSNVRDSILVYSKTCDFIWNPQYTDYDEEYIETKYRHVDEDGRRYQRDNITSPSPRPNMMYEWRGFPSPPNGWRYEKATMQRLHDENRIYYPDDKSMRPRLKRFLDEMPGRLLGNVWTDINPINSQAKERLGYPTQKPEELLERIIEASSNEGDVVLDPFCGCGTTIAVAHRLKRNWIGIDITHLAVNLMKFRLQNTFGEEVAEEYEVIGEPTDVGGAEALALQDRQQFEFWALGLVGVPPAGQTGKGADQGVDGRINVMDNAGDVHRIIVSVKSGTVHSKHISEISGVVKREDAAIGVLVTLQEPTGPMRREAASAGFWSPEADTVRADGQKVRVPRIQILTIEELLEGASIDFPYRKYGDRGFKRAPRSQQPKQQDRKLLEE